jgi:ABC-type polysaccharide/polyol phosphate export permease
LIQWLPENNRLERIWKLAEVGFKKRYYNDRLGLFWAFLNPLFQMGIYFLVIKYIFKSEEEHFALFLFCGLIIWMAFAECSTQGMDLLENNRFLIENIQFNQLDLFISHTLSVFIGLLFNLLVFFLLCVISQLPITANILVLPILLFNLFLIATGVSLILATLKIYLRDIVHLWAVLILVGFWGSGILFDGAIYKEVFLPLLYADPFVGIIMNTRLIIMKGLSPDWNLLLINLATGFAILGIGVFVFKKYAHKFLEYI